MRIAVATNAGGLEDTVSTVFARAPTFTIVDMDGDEIRDVRVIQNPAAAAGSGAGIQASQLLANEGVQVVIAGNFGPNASGVLAQAGISMISSPGTPVKDAVKNAGSAPRSAPTSAQYGAPAPAYGGYGYGMGYGGGYGMGYGRGMGMGRGRGRGRGMGYGMGYGRGYGYGMGYGAPVVPVGPAYTQSREDEIKALEEEKKAIERRLKELKEKK